LRIYFFIVPIFRATLYKVGKGTAENVSLHAETVAARSLQTAAADWKPKLPR